MASDILANVPATISVSFPIQFDGAKLDPRYVLSIKLSDLSLTRYAGTTGHVGNKLIHSESIASFTKLYIAIVNSPSGPPPTSDWVERVGETTVYSGATTYTLGNTVTDGGMTYLYINVTPASGNATSDTAHWLLLGATINYIGYWDTVAYSAANEVGSPDNATELLALARKIATDFYLWKLASLELRLPSYVEITPDGLHDFEYQHSATLTVIHRSNWEPDFGRFPQAGAYGSSSAPAEEVGAAFVIPAVDSTVTIDVVDTSKYIGGDENVEIDDGSSRIEAKIIAIVDARQITIKITLIYVGVVGGTMKKGAKIKVCCPFFPGMPVKGGQDWGIIYIDNRKYVKVEQSNFYYNELKLVLDQRAITINNSLAIGFLVEQYGVFGDLFLINCLIGQLILGGSAMKIDWNGTTQFFWLDVYGNITLGSGPGKATTDTNGFVFIGYITGKPTGTPTTKSGYVAWCVDIASLGIWFYMNGFWVRPCCGHIVSKTTGYTGEYSDFIFVDTSGGTFTLDLPAPLNNATIGVIKISTDANKCNLTTSMGGTINGGAAYSLTEPFSPREFQSDGTDWYGPLQDPSADNYIHVWDDTDKKHVDAIVGTGLTYTHATHTLSAGPADPGYDAVLGWDDTDNAQNYFHIGEGIFYDHSTHTLSGTPVVGTLTDGATINWNTAKAGDGQMVVVTIAGSRTMAAPTNIRAGATYFLKIIQGSGGSHLITWNAAFKWPNNTPPTLSTTAGAYDIISFVCYTGTTLDGVLQPNFG